MAVFHIDMMSNALMRHNSITAIIPVEKPDVPDFSVPKPDKPLKTIILLHGYRGNELDWIYETRIVSLALIHQVAVIMPAADNSFYLDDAVRGQHYEKFICKELVDFVRSVFPVSDKREDTTLAGLSMGGFGALYNGLKHSDVFGSIFAFSSALIQDGIRDMKPGDRNEVASYEYYRHVFGEPGQISGGESDPKEMARRLALGSNPLPKIFMACGTEDFLIEPNRSFHACLQENGIPHEYRECPGGHEWRLWDRWIEESMRWLYGERENPFLRR